MSGSGKGAIAVALIGAIGLAVAAWIPGYMEQKPAPEPAMSSPAAQVATASVEAPAASVSLLGARVGKTGSSGQVEVPTTRFGPKDTVSLTLRVQADPRVVDFPVRVSATLMDGIMTGREREDSVDIATPGIHVLNMQFPSSGTRMEPLVVSVEIADDKVYSQELSVDYD